MACKKDKKPIISYVLKESYDYSQKSPFDEINMSQKLNTSDVYKNDIMKDILNSLENIWEDLEKRGITVLSNSQLQLPNKKTIDNAANILVYLLSTQYTSPDNTKQLYLYIKDDQKYSNITKVHNMNANDTPWLNMP